jgi:hypothetical protein
VSKIGEYQGQPLHAFIARQHSGTAYLEAVCELTGMTPDEIL